MSTYIKVIEQAEQLRRLVNSSPMIEAMRAIQEQQRLVLSVVDFPAIRSIIESEKTTAQISALTSLKDSVTSALQPDFHLRLGLTSAVVKDSILGCSALREIEQANRRWSDLIRPLTLEIDRSAVISQLTTISDSFRGIDIPSFHAQFEPIARIVSETHRIMDAVRWDGIAALGIDVSLLAGLEFRTGRLTRAYGGLTDWMVSHPGDAIAAPPFVSKLPAFSVYSHAQALRTFGDFADEEEDEQESDARIWTDVRNETLAAIDNLLPLVNARLVPVWKGAWKTAHRREDDWARQAGSSLRHVLIAILDTVAPKDQVKAEIDRRYLNEKGEVIRRTQVVWLCKPLGNRPHAKVVFEDINSAITVIDAMSDAVHHDDCPEVERAFGRMAVRAAVALQHLLEVHMNRK